MVCVQISLKEIRSNGERKKKEIERKSEGGVVVFFKKKLVRPFPFYVSVFVLLFLSFSLELANGSGIETFGLAATVIATELATATVMTYGLATLTATLTATAIVVLANATALQRRLHLRPQDRRDLV